MATRLVFTPSHAALRTATIVLSIFYSRARFGSASHRNAAHGIASRRETPQRYLITFSIRQRFSPRRGAARHLATPLFAPQRNVSLNHERN